MRLQGRAELNFRLETLDLKLLLFLSPAPEGLAFARGRGRLFATALVFREDGFGLRGGDAVKPALEIGAVAQVACGNGGRVRLGRMGVHIRRGLAVTRRLMGIRHGLAVARGLMRIRRGLG